MYEVCKHYQVLAWAAFFNLHLPATSFFSLLSCPSLSLQPQSPPVADGRLEEMSRQLQLVQKERSVITQLYSIAFYSACALCRDQLKAELEELKASLANGSLHPGG